MNYLRGAVNAISAPYQYYKELAPINPSTLTGAIDVIVVRASTPDGEVTLSCSPFHVRFGKWQVLRPGDKKVNVFVNGKAIPFSMKIGEAGEAFFVFETDAEVPDDLITSPILEATRVGSTNTSANVQAGKFGSKEAGNTPDGSTQEPEYFDLDFNEPEESGRSEDVTTPTKTRGGRLLAESRSSSSGTLNMLASVVEAAKPANLVKTGTSLGKSVVHAVIQTEREDAEQLRDQIAAAKNIARNLSSGSRPPNGDKGDEALPPVDNESVQPNPVEYRSDVVIDMAGYHERGASERTITDSQQVGTPNSEPAGPDDSEDDDPLTDNHSHYIRATSEPPPDTDEIEAPLMTPSSSRATHSPTRRKRLHSSGMPKISVPAPEADYMWEWGAFPQKSPRVDKFDVSRRRAVRAPAGSMLSTPAPMMERAKSEPHEMDSSLGFPGSNLGSGDTPSGALSTDASLIPHPQDPMRIGSVVNGQCLWIELSVLDHDLLEHGLEKKGVLLGMEQIEAADVFDRSAISYERVLADDSVLKEDGLVIRLPDDRYITRADASPLMDSLPAWRMAALRGKLTPNRSVSFPEDPVSSGDEVDRVNGSGGPQPPRTRKTSSWARWWGRAPAVEDVEERSFDESPDPRSTASSPRMPSGTLPVVESPGMMRTNSRETSRTLSRAPSPELDSKKFIKTLRLTSDQLKDLDLRVGANSITFSLSASGAVACTARIFVWDSTDSIVISDIDGTITKSDALGHMFTMIGRDWTHIGVAKLYTDIVRNGYKIMYLTSRAIGQADSTREYLKGIKQNNYQLPEGPVIMSPDRLMASLHREVIMRKPEVFKMACLRDIRRLFGEGNNPFYAGFGNRITDALSYRSVDVPSSRIFTIDSSGDVKLELLELAGYKSTYYHMTDLVDQTFPPTHRRYVQEYTDLNFWKPPIPNLTLPDLSPPSPALSARSDTSNQSALARLRNGFILGSSGRGSPHQRSSSEFIKPYRSDRDYASQRSGLGSSPSKFARSGGSVTDITSDAEDERADWRGVRRGGPRARSADSMPGSLPGSEDDTMWEDDEEEEHDGYDHDGEDIDEHEHEHDPAMEMDDAFDDDVLAAGEMASVPFL